MSKRVMLAVIVLILLVACGESKVTGRRVAIPDSSAPTAAVIAQQSAPAETGKTAAEMLKELQSGQTITIAQTGSKTGNFYPPIAVTGTEREALRQKTRALFSQPTYDPNAEAEGEFGAKYHDNDGDPSNLPSGYSDNSGD
ncbi:MAG TPA: hypothetical protein VI612_03825 [Candidatus Nanoarchaeia archaeon]|nr:hypothetical protein [Candidatus Nanoarchaeia archaeon]